MGHRIRVALAGNPNSGKTTIFNHLTGARQHVGNYPGVTVEKKQGTCRYEGHDLHITDLPGAYGLTAYSIDELVARRFLLDEKPDVVVSVLDSSNLERNLYLFTELMELGGRFVLLMNMSDVAKARGIKFDLPQLSERLGGTPIVEAIGSKNVGTQELLAAIVRTAAADGATMPGRVDYGHEIEEELAKIEKLVEADPTLNGTCGPRWLSVKLLEGDAEVRKHVGSQEILDATHQSIRHLEGILGDSTEVIIAERRYGFVSGLCQGAVLSTVEARHTASDRVDTVLANRTLGLPIFMALMYLVFHLTFTLGELPMGWIEAGFGWLGGALTALWPKGSESVLKSLLVDGIIGGVGGVVVFLPNILLLFLAIGFLEDTGYMARAAFVMDRIMHAIGLQGRSFIPMLIGFGCSVPGIMATRTIANERDRLTTILVTPLMSCGARLPIYALVIPAFFPSAWRGTMLFSIYIIGVVLAIVCAKLLRTLVFKGGKEPFLMELPPYRLPTLKGVVIHMWERSWLYLKKAGTIILGVSIALWAMTSYPKKGAYDHDYDAQRAQARQSYLAAANALGAEMGLPAGSALLGRALQAELDMAAAQEDWHDWEPGFAAAARNRDATIASLAGQEGGECLTAFLRTVAAIRGARQRFDEAVEEEDLEEGSPEYALLERTRHEALETAKAADPRRFAAAVRFLDEIRAPFDERMEAIARAMQGENLAFSISGRIGSGLEPILRPMGFDWRIGTALVGALAAKEVFVAQMGIVYSMGEAGRGFKTLRTKLQRNYTPLVGFSIMLFCLVSAPCMATIAVTKRETNSWGWALLQLGGLTVLAYGLTLIVYQVGSLLRIGVG